MSVLMDFNPRVNVVARVCRKLYGGDPAHGWPHILRVMAWAERIVNSEGLDVDPEVLVVSVLLYDIGRLYEGSDHQPLGAPRLQAPSWRFLSTPCTGF